MSTKYKFNDQDSLYFISYAVVNWIDLFIRNEYRDIMIESWKHCQVKKGFEIYGWCIMSSHIHMIIGTHGENLENIMRDMKKPQFRRECRRPAVRLQHSCPADR